MKEISLNILDLAQNSISAGATLIEIEVNEDLNRDKLTVTIKDNGKGMSKEQLSKVTDPFYTTRKTRKVGLGIPLFKMAAEMAGGSFSLDSVLEKGTTVTGTFGLSNIDRMPLGNINETVINLIYCNPNIDFLYTRIKDENHFTLDTRVLRTYLSDVPLSTKEVREWISGYLCENDMELENKAK